MQPDTYRMLAARQGSYWWHRARRQMSRALLRRVGAPSHGAWLDLGCGPGGNLALGEAFDARLIVGVDLSDLALSLARERAPRSVLVRADIARNLPFAAASFDVATIFNVLYHRWVADEAASLREIVRVLRPGGLLLATEPAFASLGRELDVAGMAQRRFRRGDFARLLQGQGLDVLFSSYFTSFGFVPLLFINALRRAFPGSGAAPDTRLLHPLANGTLRAVAGAEAAAIAAGVPMPFGVTLVAVARKPI